MKAIRIHAVGELQMHDEPMPVAGPEETLVRVKSVGVCGSDLHWLSEGGIGDTRLARPLILGHEFAGVLENGERVAVDPAIPCNRCEFCLEGNPNFCLNLRFAGYNNQDGALREWVNWPTRLLHRLPDSIDDAEGAMLEPLGVAIHAVDLAHLRPGMTVGVFGSGPVGLLIIEMARIAGATNIIATDKLQHRVDAALEFGATTSILAADGLENDVIWEMAGERGVDVAFEVAGENAAVETAVASAKPGGKVIIVGIPGEDRTSFTASTSRRKGLTIKILRRMKHTYPRAIRLVQSGMINVKGLVTQSFPLTEYAKAFEIALKRDGLKIVVEP